MSGIVLPVIFSPQTAPFKPFKGTKKHPAVFTRNALLYPCCSPCYTYLTIYCSACIPFIFVSIYPKSAGIYISHERLPERMGIYLIINIMCPDSVYKLANAF